MIFDEIGLRKKKLQIQKQWREHHDRYHPLLAKARKEKNENEYGRLHLEAFDDAQWIVDQEEELKTERLMRRAQNLDLPVDLSDEGGWWAPPGWRIDGDNRLSSKGIFELRQAIRKEKIEQLEYYMRWVSRVVVPIVGLIGAVMGLISLIFALRHKW